MAYACNKKSSMPISEKKWVSDGELAEYLGVCRNTARKIAEEAGAVFKIGGIRRTNLNMIDASASNYYE